MKCLNTDMEEILLASYELRSVAAGLRFGFCHKVQSSIMFFHVVKPFLVVSQRMM